MGVGAAFGKEFDNGIHLLGSFGAADQAKISSYSSVADRKDFLRRTARITNRDPNGPTEITRNYVAPTTFTNGGIIVRMTGPTINRMGVPAKWRPEAAAVQRPGCAPPPPPPPPPSPPPPPPSLISGCLCYATNDPNNLGIDFDNRARQTHSDVITASCIWITI